MNLYAKTAIGLFCAAGVAAAIWFVGVRRSGETLEQAAERERAEQRGENAEICRLARQRLNERSGDEKAREQDQGVVRVKCEPLGL